MRQSVLAAVHRSEARALGEFHGWELPLDYGAPTDEFDAAMHGAVLLDHSWYGRLEIRGKDGLDLLHRLSTNDLLALQEREVAGTVLTTDKGKVLDYAKVARLEPLVLVVSPGNEATVQHWIERYTIMEDVSVRSITDETVMFTIAGPHAVSLAQKALSVELREGMIAALTRPYGVVQAVALTTPRVQMVHLMSAAQVGLILWQELSALARGHGIRKMGMLAYEAFRICRGIPAFPTEINTDFTPYDAGLTDVISYKKGCYIGQEVIARLDTYQKARRRPIGLLLLSGLTVQEGRLALLKQGEQVGWLTSASPISVHEHFPAFGIVRGDLVREGDRLILSAHPSIHCIAMTTPVVHLS